MALIHIFILFEIPIYSIMSETENQIKNDPIQNIIMQNSINSEISIILKFKLRKQQNIRNFLFI